jgi:hypothetical protein
VPAFYVDVGAAFGFGFVVAAPLMALIVTL